MRPSKYAWKDLLIDTSNIQTNWKETLQDPDGAPYRARQPAVHAAQDEESDITTMQEIQSRERTPVHVLSD